MARTSRRSRRRRPADVDTRTASRRSRIRLGIVVGLTFALFGTIVVRLVDVQFNQREFWQQHGADSRVAREELRVERGGIFDRNGNALALSVYRPNVVADPTEVRDPAGMAEQLAEILGEPAADLEAKLRKTNRYQLLARNVEQEVMDQLVTPSGRTTPVGIYYEYAASREYPGEEIARSLVGRTYAAGGHDSEGRSGRYGVEATLDDELQGEPGYVIYEKDRGGGPIASSARLLHQPTPGMNVYLTIDQGLQYATQQALIERLEQLGASEATAVIMRASTGEILTMATVAHGEDGTVAPTGDNRAATTIYEPGSVNKAFTIAGAMEEGHVGPETLRRVPAQLQMANKLFTDHDWHAEELWSTADILSNSSNIGTIQIAQGLGEKRLDSYLRSFGFGSTTGSDVPGELRGLMPGIDEWSGTTLGSIAIGQTLAVTPLQLLAGYNVFANDGLFVAPHTIGATDRGDGKQAVDRSAPRRVVSEETAVSMRAMLSRVVSDGTGRAAAVPGYRAWGKTGTARLPQENPTDPNDGYLNADGGYDYASTFVGGVEGTDITILVVIKEPRTETTGGAAAAPVFAHLASLTLRSLRIPPPPADSGGVPAPPLAVTARADLGGDPGADVSQAQG